MITIRDVARLAEVSTATVSRFFLDSGIVSAAAQERIEKAVKQLKYTPNSLASMLKSSRSNSVGLIISDVSNIFFNQVISALNKLLTEKNKRLIVLYRNAQSNVKDQIRTLLSLRVDSIIFMPEKPSDTIENLLTGTKCYPLQLFIDSYKNLDSLIVDDTQGCFLAANELITSGHEKILIIDIDNIVFHKRLEGFKRAYQESGKEFKDDYILIFPDLDFTEHQNEIIHRIETLKPTAIISVTNNTTQFVVYLLNKLGLKIYDDISLIMYDESEWARYQNITTVAQPLDEMLVLIKNMLGARLWGQTGMSDTPLKSIVHPNLIRRNSVKKL